MQIFIDGYNLIFAASGPRSGFDIRQTEAAREKLLGLLAKYKSLRKDRIVVFFDSGPEAAHLPRRSFGRGMETVFSALGTDADTEIKNAVSHASAPQEIRVVTSDGAIRGFVQKYGAQVIGSREFLHEIGEALKEHKLPQDEPIEKYEGGAPDADADYWIRVFGEESVNDKD